MSRYASRTCRIRPWWQPAWERYGAYYVPPPCTLSDADYPRRLQGFANTRVPWNGTELRPNCDGLRPRLESLWCRYPFSPDLWSIRPLSR